MSLCGKIISVCFVCLLLGYLTPVRAVEGKKTSSPEEDLAQKRERVEAERKANRKKIAERFPGYGKYAKEFKSLCESMALDGRNGFFREIGVQNNVKSETCAGCKHFYKQLSKSCRTKVVKNSKKRKKDEPAPDAAAKKAVIKQRMPHVVASQRASEIGYILESDRRWMHEHYVVLKDIQHRIANSATTTNGEKEYAALLLASMLIHFEEHEAALEKAATKNKRNEQSQSFYERDKIAEAELLKELFEEEP